MANIENNESLNLKMIKVLLLEMIALNDILRITIKTFLGNQRLPGSPLSRIKSSISLRFPEGKMNLSLLPSLNLK
jgi:hypothetical protein